MPDELAFFDPARKQLIDAALARRVEVFNDPTVIHWWRRPCTVKALLVTDGALDFGKGDFGLSTFVDTLINDSRSYVRFELTLAHLSPSVTDAQVMSGAPGIARSIKGLMFDDPNHFDANMYDEVWLFGIETNFDRAFYSNRQGNPQYPSNRLGDAELLRLTQHMNRGGGLFATGDHGTLGKALCGAVDKSEEHALLAVLVAVTAGAGRGQHDGRTAQRLKRYRPRPGIPVQRPKRRHPAAARAKALHDVCRTPS